MMTRMITTNTINFSHNYLNCIRICYYLFPYIYFSRLNYPKRELTEPVFLSKKDKGIDVQYFSSNHQPFEAMNHHCIIRVDCTIPGIDHRCLPTITNCRTWRICGPCKLYSKCFQIKATHSLGVQKVMLTIVVELS